MTVAVPAIQWARVWTSPGPTNQTKIAPKSVAIENPQGKIAVPPTWRAKPTAKVGGKTNSSATSNMENKCETWRSNGGERLRAKWVALAIRDRSSRIENSIAIIAATMLATDAGNTRSHLSAILKRESIKPEYKVKRRHSGCARMTASTLLVHSDLLLVDADCVAA